MKVRKIRSEINPSLASVQLQLSKLPKAGYKFFRAITPKDKGNARQNTRLAGNTIKADYKYATRLNEGSSKQAPRGMTDPMVEYLDKLVRKILGR